MGSSYVSLSLSFSFIFETLEYWLLEFLVRVLSAYSVCLKPKILSYMGKTILFFFFCVCRYQVGG